MGTLNMDIESLFDKLSDENDRLQTQNDDLQAQNIELITRLKQLELEKLQALDWYYDLCEENDHLVSEIELLRSFQTKQWLRCPNIHPYQEECLDGAFCNDRTCRKWHHDTPCPSGHKCRSISKEEKNLHYDQVLADNPSHICPHFHPCQIRTHNFECHHGESCRDSVKKACIGYHSGSMCPNGDSCKHLHSFWKKLIEN